MSEHPAYPLGQNAKGHITAASGRKLSEITLDALADDRLSAADMQIQSQTLREQAHVAQQAGYTQLAENLVRAAELTAVPNEELLQMYETIRPGRATHAEMLEMANRLEQTYSAIQNATLVREAAEVYLARGLVRKA